VQVSHTHTCLNGEVNLAAPEITFDRTTLVHNHIFASFKLDICRKVNLIILNGFSCCSTLKSGNTDLPNDLSLWMMIAVAAGGQDIHGGAVLLCIQNVSLLFLFAFTCC